MHDLTDCLVVKLCRRGQDEWRFGMLRACGPGAHPAVVVPIPPSPNRRKGQPCGEEQRRRGLEARAPIDGQPLHEVSYGMSRLISPQKMSPTLPGKGGPP